jgi:hypothetical protein
MVTLAVFIYSCANPFCSLSCGPWSSHGVVRSALGGGAYDTVQDSDYIRLHSANGDGGGESRVNQCDIDQGMVSCDIL